MELKNVSYTVKDRNLESITRIRTPWSVDPEMVESTKILTITDSQQSIQFLPPRILFQAQFNEHFLFKLELRRDVQFLSICGD